MVKEVFYVRLDRRNFGDLLNSDRARALGWRIGNARESMRPRPHGTELIAITSVDPQAAVGRLPELLVCEDGTDVDWAAWITTYGARLRPFTAYTRLLTTSEFDWHLAALRRQPSLQSTVWSAAGLILGEIMATGRLADRDIQTLPAVALSSTLTFAMMRIAALYDTFENWDDLLNYWDFVRTATGQRLRILSGAAIFRVARCFIDAADLQHPRTRNSSDHDLTRLCAHIVRSRGEPPPDFFREAAFAQTFERMQGTREDRVSALDGFIQRLDRLRSEPEVSALMLGFLTSRIAPGTLQHMGVLAPALERWPTAPLWYGISAGLGHVQTDQSSRNDSTDLPSVTRRIARDLLREEPLFGPPTCDIAVLELLALSRSGNPLQNVITTTHGTVVVELVPGVITSVSVSRGGQPDAAPITRVSQTEVIAELEEAIDAVRRVQRRLQGGAPVTHDDDGGQQKLFTSKRRTRK